MSRCYCPCPTFCEKVGHCMSADHTAQEMRCCDICQKLLTGGEEEEACDTCLKDGETQ